jgi:CheY-like chemotaxis protein
VRLLIVDDDAGLRALFRTTFEVVDVEVEEAANGVDALAAIQRGRPDAVVLDVRMPGMDGLELCRRIKADPALAGVSVVLLSGAGDEGRARAHDVGADAFMLKPFSPLELLNVVGRVTGGLAPAPPRPLGVEDAAESQQILLYARDLRHLLEIERGQRALLENAYQETVAALASALESKDTGTRAHSQRVQRYALELARHIEPDQIEDPRAE